MVEQETRISLVLQALLVGAGGKEGGCGCKCFLSCCALATLVRLVFCVCLGMVLELTQYCSRKRRLNEQETCLFLLNSSDAAYLGT